MNKKLSANGANILKGFEAPNGPALMPYPDSTGHSTGFGHLIQKGEEYLMNKISRATADQLFSQDVKKAENVINTRIKRELTQNQFDACVCLAYNYPNAFYDGSIEDKINADVPRAILEATWKQYKYSRDKEGNLITLDALVARRAQEIQLYYSSALASTVKQFTPLLMLVLLIVGAWLLF